MHNYLHGLVQGLLSFCERMRMRKCEGMKYGKTCDGYVPNGE